MTAPRHARPLAALVAMLLLAGSIIGQQPALANGHDEDNTLEGSWFITITGTPFSILRTYTKAGNGIVDAYAFPPITPTPGPLVNSAGHGSWKRTGTRRFTATVKYFQLNPALNGSFQTLDSVGTVRETIRLSKDGRSYTSEFSTEIALPNGMPIIQNAGATTATRIDADPHP